MSFTLFKASAICRPRTNFGAARASAWPPMARRSSDAALSAGSPARAVSADGNVIAGHTGEGSWRWTAAGGMESLGSVPHGIASAALGISADSSAIVGEAILDSNQDQVAFRWTVGTGMVSLGD